MAVKTHGEEAFGRGPCCCFCTPFFVVGDAPPSPTSTRYELDVAAAVTAACSASRRAHSGVSGDIFAVDGNRKNSSSTSHWFRASFGASHAAGPSLYASSTNVWTC